MLKKLSTLQIALLVSVGVHAALVTMRFVDPAGFNRIFEDTPLEVVLVNARSNEPPTKAQAIAQANLNGGGEATRGLASSPLPPSPTIEIGDTNDEAKQQIEQLQHAQQQLLAQVRCDLAELNAPDPKRDRGAPNERSQQERRKQLMQLLAQIEKRVNEENARPKRKHISPSTREEAYAIYYDALRRKIEERGTRNFPEQGGRKLFGELTMVLTVDSQGRIVDAEVAVPSKSKVLDNRAVAIARAAAPFGSFTPAMRQQADQLVIPTRFNFTREQNLETTLQGQASR